MKDLLARHIFAPLWWTTASDLALATEKASKTGLARLFHVLGMLGDRPCLLDLHRG